nr:3-oxoacyl-[acyl-carrier-protein] synthase 3 A, chloroplastic-like [Tanacetum cinerariifolium]
MKPYCSFFLRDRSTCILFGDAAGAVLVQACDDDEDGLFGFDLHTDGDGSRYLYAGIKQNKMNDSIGGSDLGIYPNDKAISHLQINGKQIFRFVVNAVPQSIEASLAKSGHKLSEIDWLLVHQANQRIIDNEAVRSGKVKKGETIMIAGFGAGLTWGSALDNNFRTDEVLNKLDLWALVYSM